MKITRERANKAGKRIVTVEVGNDETLLAFKPDAYYKLGEEINDIVRGGAIIDSGPAYWCQIEQKWIV